MAKKTPRQFLLCVKNDSYPASLELRKVYEVLPESGEDYLYPESYFVPIELPQTAMTAFVQAS
jgi:hypothetical protein